MSQQKLILVVGATGAQGIAVIDALLAPNEDGLPSPYSVRALTRDTSSKRALELTAKGVECVKGATDDLPSIVAAFEGVYGAWINTDSFTIGAQKEIYAGIKIFEIAKRSKTVRHYVWSSLDYATKKSGYRLDYNADHYDAKGTVADWLKAQPSVVSEDELSWSAVSTGPYMNMLDIDVFGPLNKREDGTYVFASPVGDGHVPMIALSDLGWWARYTFDHRTETSGKDLEIASEMVGWDDLVKTFTKVTGKPAVFKRQTVDQWWGNFTHIDGPVASEKKEGDGSTTVRQNFSSFWRLYRDDIIQRDVEWLRRVHPKGKTVESWMREHNYTGELRGTAQIKSVEEGRHWGINYAITSQL